MEFKRPSTSYAIGSVKANLTHGFSSDVFERKGVSFEYEKKIDFDVNRPIKRVKGAYYNNGNSYCTYAVKFMDKQGKQVSICDPVNSIDYWAGKEHQLSDNEELIGVYGVNDKKDWFSSFGFI